MPDDLQYAKYVAAKHASDARGLRELEGSQENVEIATVIRLDLCLKEPVLMKAVRADEIACFKSAAWWRDCYAHFLAARNIIEYLDLA